MGIKKIAGAVMRGRVELGSCEGLHRLVWLGLKLEAVHVVDSVRTFVELPRVPPSPREHRRGRADGRVYPSAQGLMGRDVSTVQWQGVTSRQEPALFTRDR